MSLSVRLNKWLRGGLPTWYDPSYRLPVVSAESALGLEPRCADFVAWTLVDRGVLGAADLRHPPRATWAQLARVHSAAHLESLNDPATLRRVFGLPDWDTPVEELLLMLRLVVGGAIEATREALRREGPTLNLMGGFHHAFPDRGEHLSLVNDVAIAVAEARAMGFEGRVGVLDLDAHPPDGTAACLIDDPKAWIGSVSEAGWPSVPGVEELNVPQGADDPTYLAAVKQLLAQMPRCGLVYVVAGADVLARDRVGRLEVTEAGARRRDLAVAAALGGTPSVWVPGGGYSQGAWRALVGTAMALSEGSEAPLPEGYAPMRRRFARIFRDLDRSELGEADAMSSEALDEALGMGGGEPRWLGYYSAEGLQHAFYEYGVLDQLRRLGYCDFRVDIDRSPEAGERMALMARGARDADPERGAEAPQEQLLIECVASRELLGDDWMLYINWLTLRHPRAQFSPGRRRLPGQDVPGLGLAPEITEMLSLVAQRLDLGGVWFRPSHYHVAYSGRRMFRFTDAARQGRFEAMLRDLRGRPLAQVTQAVDEGRIRLNGEPYAWEASGMVYVDARNEPEAAWVEEMAAVREASRFEVVEG